MISPLAVPVVDAPTPAPTLGRISAPARPGRGRARLFSALALCVLCLSFGWGARVARAAPTAAAAPTTRPRVGDKAPPFVLKTVDLGEERALDNLVRGQATRGAVLVFLSARCPYVVQARQPLAELVKQYGAKVAFVGVNANQNESAEEVKTDAAQNFAFPMLRDQGSKVADLYAAERTPEVFLVDPKGVIRYHGGVAELGAALGDFTAGRPVAKAEVKAFGCTIKRKP